MLRVDGGYALPEGFVYLEKKRVGYAIGMASSTWLKELADSRMKAVRGMSQASGSTERDYVDEQ